MTRVAWIGLGAMGVRMAGRLVHAGHDLTVWNRTPARAAALTAAGARQAATPADAVRHAEAVFLMLADPAALAEVTEGPTGVASGVGAGATVLEMSTVGPAAVVRLRAVLPDSVMLLDAPVVGSLAEADAGTLTLLVGGSPDAVTKARPLLLILGDAVHLGPTGAGAAGYAGLHRVAQPRPVSRPDARTAWYQRPGRHRPRAALHVGGRWRTPRAAIFGA